MKSEFDLLSSPQVNLSIFMVDGPPCCDVPDQLKPISLLAPGPPTHTRKLAGNILNVLAISWVGIWLVLCPFPCNVFVMCQGHSTLVLPVYYSAPLQGQLVRLAVLIR